MSKITFEIEVAESEVPSIVDELKDIIQDLEFPPYKIGVDGRESAGGARVAIDAPSLEIDSFAQWVGEAFPQCFVDDEAEDETDPCIVFPGQVVDLPNGLVYQVFSIDATGRVVLDQLEELTDEEVFH